MAPTWSMLRLWIASSWKKLSAPLRRISGVTGHGSGAVTHCFPLYFWPFFCPSCKLLSPTDVKDSWINGASFLIIIPAVAQNVVNRSELTLTHAYVLDPKPESIILTMAASLKLPLSLPVSMNPIALDLFNREQPMNNTIAKVYLPHTMIKGPTTLGVTNTPTLLDPEQWYNFVWKAVHQAHPPLSVRGSTNAFLGELKNHIKLNKDIPQTGR